MRLAAAGRAEQQQVGAFVEPSVAGTQCRDLSLRYHRYGGKIEVIEDLIGGQLRFAEMAFDAPTIALGDFVFRECHQETSRRPALFVRSLDKLLPQVFDGWQPQFVQE